MASLQTEPPPAQPSDKARRRSGAFIAAFVVLQFLIPLSYLTRDDAADERFTWRRLTEPAAPRCTADASLERLDGAHEAIPMDKLIHQDWVAYVAQGRRAVVDAFMKKQCEDEEVVSVALRNHCDDSRGVREFTLRCGGERAHETERTAGR